jgi:hypothetical protein
MTFEGGLSGAFERPFEGPFGFKHKISFSHPFRPSICRSSATSWLLERYFPTLGVVLRWSFSWWLPSFALPPTPQLLHNVVKEAYPPPSRFFSRYFSASSKVIFAPLAGPSAPSIAPSVLLTTSELGPFHASSCFFRP